MLRLVVYTWLCVVFVGTVVGAPLERQVRQPAAGANEATAIVTTIHVRAVCHRIIAEVFPWINLQNSQKFSDQKYVGYNSSVNF